VVVRIDAFSSGPNIAMRSTATTAIMHNLEVEEQTSTSFFKHPRRVLENCWIVILGSIGACGNFCQSANPFNRDIGSGCFERTRILSPLFAFLCKTETYCTVFFFEDPARM
jgi:hypothetical protein